MHPIIFFRHQESFVLQRECLSRPGNRELNSIQMLIPERTSGRTLGACLDCTCAVILELILLLQLGKLLLSTTL